MIYLDYNATTPLAPVVLEAMAPFLSQHFGNPSSIHAAGREARAAIDDARDRWARILRGKPHEVIFTGGGTESDNLAILGLARAHSSRGRHLITCTTEHHAVLHAFDHLETKEGFQVTRLPVDSSGRLDLQTLEDAIRADTILVSLMIANNETGVIHPVHEIAALCRARGVLFHTDAIQAFGKLDLGAASDFDAVSLAAHKFYGPKGVGLLYLRSGLKLERLQHGGAHESQRRPGTENVAAIVGMTAAAEWVLPTRDVESARQLLLRERLWQGIQSAVPSAIRNGSPEGCLANTLNVSFPGCDGEGLLMALDLEGIAASSGSACMVGSVEPSHVLLSMGAEPALAAATVRFSLGKNTTEAEIDETVSRLGGIIARLEMAFR